MAIAIWMLGVEAAIGQRQTEAGSVQQRSAVGIERDGQIKVGHRPLESLLDGRRRPVQFGHHGVGGPGGGGIFGPLHLSIPGARCVVDDDDGGKLGASRLDGPDDGVAQLLDGSCRCCCGSLMTAPFRAAAAHGGDTVLDYGQNKWQCRVLQIQAFVLSTAFFLPACCGSLSSVSLNIKNKHVTWTVCIMSLLLYEQITLSAQAPFFRLAQLDRLLQRQTHEQRGHQKLTLQRRRAPDYLRR